MKYIILIVLIITGVYLISKKRKKNTSYNKNEIQYPPEYKNNKKELTESITNIETQPTNNKLAFSTSNTPSSNFLTTNNIQKYIDKQARNRAIEILQKEGIELTSIFNEDTTIFDYSELDSLFTEAAEIIVLAQQGSASLLQRKLKLGYNRAGRLLDQLEAFGIIGSCNDAKIRTVLISDLRQLDQLLQEIELIHQQQDKHPLLEAIPLNQYTKDIEDIAQEMVHENIKLLEQQEFERERWEIEQEKQRIVNEIKQKERKKAIRQQAIQELKDEGHYFEEELERSRHISQEVKDLVWNRDKGTCVQCGSNYKLEFDHIIPFSEGGANTYRNIQLLCENCNRTKSNKIG